MFPTHTPLQCKWANLWARYQLNYDFQFLEQSCNIACIAKPHAKSFKYLSLMPSMAFHDFWGKALDGSYVLAYPSPL
jgi:hypothetical protein